MDTTSTAVFRLSPHQKAIWQSQGNTCREAVCQIELDGPIDPERLRDALRGLVARHEILRTVYRLQPGMKTPFQVVLEQSEPVWESAPAQNGFVLTTGPLVRAQFNRLTETRSTLLLTAPAIAADARSLQILVRDLAALYGSSDPGEEPLRYAQFAQWQLDLLEGNEEGSAEARDFWEKQRKGAGLALALPETLPPGEEFRPESVPVVLPGEAPSEETLLAAWQTLLWRLTGQTHFETRAWTPARDYEELEAAVGAIGKFVPVPARFDGDFSFRDVVGHVRDSLAEAASWQEHLSPGEGAPDAIAFEYISPATPDVAGDVSFTLRRIEVVSERFLLKLSAFGPELRFHFDAARLKRETVERWAGHYQTLLHAALAQPGKSAALLPLLSEAGQQLMVAEWNRTEADYPAHRRLNELFEEQAARTPAAPAVRAGSVLLTYSELNGRANRIARRLVAMGVKPGALVGLAPERGVDLIAGLLGILKAGAAYVPLNPENPKPRLSQQMALTSALVTETRFAAQLADFAGPTLLLDSDSALAAEPGENLDVAGSSEDLIYVIFTSGSTGTPKGVGVRHRNLVNYACFIRHLVKADEAPLNFATVSTLTADLGNTCVFPALISGGCLDVIAQDVSADTGKMASHARLHPADVLKIVPSHLEALLATSEGAGILPRKFLITGGEGLTRRLVDRIEALAPACRIINHYGPTETTVGSLTYPLRGGEQTIPIGRPIANTRVYILDSHLQPVPIGVAGELYIGGDGVTSGYLGQPELTAERFLNDPFAPGRMYRTGDLTRYRPDGNVEFLGRADDQVKIRGFRIEPGEIEAVVRRYPGVRQAAVIARRNAAGEMRLIGYLVMEPGQPFSESAVRTYLKEQLPDYMTPAALVALPRLPLTPNGKIDRRNLPEPEQVQVKEYVAPRSPAETAVAAIWSEVFRRDRIGVEEDFFEIGGHSLTATQVISRVREQFQVMLDMRTIFERPTIAGMASAIETARTEPAKAEPAIVAVSRERYRRK